MKKIYSSFVIISLFSISQATLTSCQSSSDADDALVDINLPADDGDTDCCSLETEEDVLRYELGLHQVYTGLAPDSRYTIRAYAATDSLHAGYNEVYFTVVKTASKRHVKDVKFSGITPLMNMSKMNMKHSTPVGDISQVQSYLPLFKSWISFIMPSSEANTWALSFDYTIKDSIQGTVANLPLSVNALSNDAAWVKSFKYNGEVYFLSLVNSTNLTTGQNTIEAYLSKKSKDITQPYQLASEQFTIDITPTMPDMGNHTSPDNQALVSYGGGLYRGVVNLTMTGRWDLHLTVKDSDGNIIYSPDDDGNSLSDLFWVVNI